MVKASLFQNTKWRLVFIDLVVAYESLLEMLCLHLVVTSTLVRLIRQKFDHFC